MLISTKLSTKHPLVKGIQVCSNEGPCSFPRGDNYDIAKIHWQNFKNLLLQNHWANFNQTWCKGSFIEGNSFQVKEPDLYLRGDNNEKAKSTLTKFASFNQTWCKSFLLKWTQVRSNDNSQIAKMNWRNSKIFFSRTIGQISIKYRKSILVCKGLKVLPIKDHSVLKK